MTARGESRFLPWADAFLLVAWGALLCASQGGDGVLEGLVHPFFGPLCFVAGLILIALGCVRVVLFRIYARNGGAGGRDAGMLGRVSVFLPLVAVPFLSPEGYSLSVLQNRGLAASGNTPPVISADTGSSDLVLRDGVWHMSVLDAWLISRSAAERSEFESARVSMSGQLFRMTESGEPPVLFRLWVTCCLADATPVGVRLDMSGCAQNSTFTDLSWIQIEGVLRFPGDLNSPPEIKVEKARAIARPPRPHLFR